MRVSWGKFQIPRPFGITVAHSRLPLRMNLQRSPRVALQQLDLFYPMKSFQTVPRRTYAVEATANIPQEMPSEESMKELELKAIKTSLGGKETGHLLELHGGGTDTWRYYAMKMFGYHSKKTILVKNSQVLYEFICEQGERMDFYDIYGLPKDISGWYMLTLLHMWMVYVRLRVEGEEGLRYQQLIFDAFWADVESRILNLGVDNPIVLSGEQKKLANVYYGFMVALDEALVEGDAYFADAVWRNMWKMEDTCTPQRLNAMVHYIRKELQSLDKTEGRLLFGGLIRWGDPVPLPE